MDLTALTVPELLQLRSGTMTELDVRGLIGTGNTHPLEVLLLPWKSFRPAFP